MARLPMYQRVGKPAFKKSLHNISALCQALGEPQQKIRAIHIAGTNGKGSTAHLLAAIFQAAGYKTGLYTSPHLKNFTERIKINGQEISQNAVVNFVENYKTLIEKINPSFFEVTVAMAFWYFAQEQPDLVIVETGLGGEFDSTNILPAPLLCLITNISTDHTAILGNTLAEIAAAKAGIIKKNTPVVIGEKQAALTALFEEKAKQYCAPIFYADELLSVKQEGKQVDVFRKDGLWLEKLRPGLAGKHQIRNLKSVLASIEVIGKTTKTPHETALSVSDEAIRKGVAQVCTLTNFKGRWQQIDKNPSTFCDVAHNLAGVHTLLELLAEHTYENLYVVWGMVADKKVTDILAILPKNAYYIFCTPPLPRGMHANLLLQKASASGLKGEAIEDVHEAYRAARKLAQKTDFILIGGSTFVVAALPI